jgi:hypothetical protein
MSLSGERGGEREFVFVESVVDGLSRTPETVKWRKLLGVEVDKPREHGVRELEAPILEETGADFRAKRDRISPPAIGSFEMICGRGSVAQIAPKGDFGHNEKLPRKFRFSSRIGARLSSCTKLRFEVTPYGDGCHGVVVMGEIPKVSNSFA